MRRYYLGIDLGTTCVKSILFDCHGNACGSASREYDLLFTADGVEQDANLWWTHSADTAREAVRQSGVDPKSIDAISVSTQGISGVLTDARGTPLMNALSWLDARSRVQIDQILSFIDADTLFTRTGKNPNAYALPQLMWLKQHRPAQFARAAHYLLPLDFLMLRMTGRPLMDASIACGTLAFDVRERRLIPELVAFAGIPEGCLSPTGLMGDAAGTLTAAAAAQMGLLPGIRVVLGAQDQRCAALGAGIAPGVATISLGTAAAMCMLTDHCVPDPMRHVTLVCADAGHWMTESVVSTAGAALKWFRNTVMPECSYDQITQLAAESPCGANGVLFFPELSEADPDQPAGCFIGLRLSSTRADMARALLEGVSFALMRSLRQHERLAGPCREIRVFGGGARSALWQQILADMTGRPVVLPHTSETGCLGAAMLAARSGGELFSPDDMLQPPRECSMPDPDAVRKYESLRKRCESMRERFGQI